MKIKSESNPSGKNASNRLSENFDKDNPAAKTLFQVNYFYFHQLNEKLKFKANKIKLTESGCF